MHRIRSRQFHRLTGIILLLPFLVWSLSGIFFLVRPGYNEAYEQIPVRRYDIDRSVSTLPFSANTNWQEVRYFRSLLGEHLLVNENDSWRHLNVQTGEDWLLPEETELQRFLEDAISFNAPRYGRIIRIEDATAWTDTGVEISVDWTTASIRQQGRDTRWIDRIYSLHYLQWTGYWLSDRILGVLGLLLLLYMTYSGARMAFTKAEPLSRKAS